MDGRLTGHPGAGESSPGQPLRRRDFLFRLGAGAGAAVAGFVLLDERPDLPADPLLPLEPASRPRLRRGVSFGRHQGLASIGFGREGSRVLCAVNEPGARILRLLDGRATVDGISRTLVERAGLPWTEETRAGVALFIVQLSALGLLTRRYMATVFEVEAP